MHVCVCVCLCMCVISTRHKYLPFHLFPKAFSLSFWRSDTSDCNFKILDCTLSLYNSNFSFIWIEKWKWRFDYIFAMQPAYFTMYLFTYLISWWYLICWPTVAVASVSYFSSHALVWPSLRKNLLLIEMGSSQLYKYALKKINSLTELKYILPDLHYWFGTWSGPNSSESRILKFQHTLWI